MKIEINSNFRQASFKTIDGFRFYDYQEIIYLKADGNCALLFTTADVKSIRIFEHFNDLMSSLPKDRFLRCHRSYIVNLKHIRIYKRKCNEIEMTNKTTVPVSKTYEKELFKIRQST